MKPYELLGVLLRFLGVVLSILGVNSLFNLLVNLQLGKAQQAAIRAQFNRIAPIQDETALFWSGMYIAAQLAVGIVLFFGANAIVWLAYPRDVPPRRLGPVRLWLAHLSPAVRTNGLMIATLLLALIAIVQIRIYSPGDLLHLIHTALLVTIAATALAYLARHRRRPLNTFLLVWLVALGVQVTRAIFI